MSTHTNSRIPSHTATAALAAAIAAVVSPLLQSVPADRDVQAVLDTSQPHPRDFIRIQEGTPFTVPAGRMLVISGMGFASNPGASSGYQTVEIDGVPVLSEFMYTYTDFHDQKLTAIPQGVTAFANQVVSAASNRDDCVLLGYLVDA